jgi:hypothetical protein
MATLAGRLLTGLMAEPMSLPFDALARGQLPHTHTYTSSGAQQQEQQRSLLTCALLSYNRHSLAQVLEWGRTYGGGAQGCAWAWSTVDACGYSPMQIMQRLPAGHAILDLLLADPSSRPAAQQAQAAAWQMGEAKKHTVAIHAAAGPRSSDSCSAVHTQHVILDQHRALSCTNSDPFSVGAERAADSTALMQTAIHAAAPRTLSHPNSGISSMGAKKSADSTTAAAVATSSQRSLCSPSSQDAHPPVTWKFVLRALVLGFDSQGAVNETDYRSVCGKQQASVWQAAGLCVCQTICQCVAGCRSVCGRQQVSVWQAAGLCVCVCVCVCVSDHRSVCDQ